MRRLALLLAIACVPAFGASAAPTGAEPGATVLDRAFRCETLLSGGIREIEARAHAGVRAGRAWKKLPFAGVVSGEDNLDYALVWISAGRPTATTNLEEDFNHIPVSGNGTLAIRSGCRLTRTRVPLTTKGLDGGQVGPFSKKLDCATPRQVFVRVRATLERAEPLRGRDGFLRITSAIRAAAFAVHAPSGRPIVYASVTSSGRARLFTGRTCFPD